MSMTEQAIAACGLRKVYSSFGGRKRITALDGIDLTIAAGEIFGLLGPNGAGKTTTVKIMLGLTHPTEGSAKILGIPVGSPECRRKVGYLPEGHRFPGYLTARQTLSILARMSGVDPSVVRARIPAMLERVRMSEWIDVKVKKFSKGMTQRIGLAAALIHDPAVLLLDEPTDGVDPVGRREIRDILHEEARRGRTILLNSHLLSEIELTCDRVAVLRKGRMAAQGRIEDLTRCESQYKLSASPVDAGLIAALRELGAGVTQQNGHVLLSVRDISHLNAVVDKVRAAGGLISELSPVRSTLEDVFVDLVRTENGEGARAQAAQPAQEVHT